jgi:hypothetical protein
VNWATILLAATSIAATGCSTLRPYREAYPENLTFSVTGGSLLTSTEVSLNIFFADAACNKNYQGSVSLSPGEAPERIGLPTDRDVYARIWVESHGWLQNSSKTRSHEFRFKPRRGHQYGVEYVHEKKAYAMRLTETDPRTGKTQELRGDDWGACEPQQTVQLRVGGKEE